MHSGNEPLETQTDLVDISSPNKTTVQLLTWSGERKKRDLLQVFMLLDFRLDILLTLLLILSLLLFLLQNSSSYIEVARH